MDQAGLLTADQNGNAQAVFRIRERALFGFKVSKQKIRFCRLNSGGRFGATVEPARAQILSGSFEKKPKKLVKNGSRAAPKRRGFKSVLDEVHKWG